MNKFEYWLPTKIVFGYDSEDKIADLCLQYNRQNVLLVYGKSPKELGLIDYIKKQLDEAGITSYELGGVVPNPRLSFVYEAKKMFLDKDIDLVLGIGGGSAIDSAKAISLALANPEDDIWSYFKKEKEPRSWIPVGAVLTIAAAGSETSNSAVLTNEETGQKRGFRHDFNKPVFAIMNPYFMVTLKKEQIACGASDIIFHTLDRYFTNKLGNHLTDRIAESVIKTVIEFAPKSMAKPSDYLAHSELMWASSLSHNGLTGLGGADDFSTHQLGHELSAMFDIEHGKSLTAVWESYARYVCAENYSRFAQFGRNVFDLQEADDEKCCDLAITKMIEFFKSIGMPTKFSECSFNILSDEQIERLADNCSYQKTRTIGCFKQLAYEDILKIYQNANI